MIIRAVDGGGTGFRRADIDGTKVVNFCVTRRAPKNVSELMRFVKNGLPKDCAGVSYAIAGIIKNNDTFVNSPNIHFLDGISLAKETVKATGLPSGVFNDMEAAVTGMATLLPHEKYFMGITWSSGIGLRIWNNGKILSTAEGGHCMLDPSPFAPLCGCGKRGHAEGILSGIAIAKRVISETQALHIALPKDIDPCKFLDKCYKNKETWAVELYDVISNGMGIFLANIQSVLHLPLIAWKGSVALHALKLIEYRIRRSMELHIIDPTWTDKDNLRFVLSPKPEFDSLIGAAALFEPTNVISDCDMSAAS